MMIKIFSTKELRSIVSRAQRLPRVVVVIGCSSSSPQLLAGVIDGDREE